MRRGDGCPVADGLGGVVVGAGRRGVVRAVDLEEGGFDHGEGDHFVAPEVFDEVGVCGAGGTPGHFEEVEGCEGAGWLVVVVVRLGLELW